MNWEAIDAVGVIMAAMFFTPTGCRFWQEVKHFYAGSQMQAVDARIARGQLPDIRNTFLMDTIGYKKNKEAQEGLI